MTNPINTVPLQQYFQMVKSAELSNQREVRLDIKFAKQLSYCLGEMNAKMIQDYDQLVATLMSSTGQVTTIQMDGGGFK